MEVQASAGLKPLASRTMTADGSKSVCAASREVKLDVGSWSPDLVSEIAVLPRRSQDLRYYLDDDPWEGCGNLAQEGMDEWNADCARLLELRQNSSSSVREALVCGESTKLESFQSVPLDDLLATCYRDASKQRVPNDLKPSSTPLSPPDSVTSVSTAASLGDFSPWSTRSIPKSAYSPSESIAACRGKHLIGITCSGPMTPMELNGDHAWEDEFLARCALG